MCIKMNKCSVCKEVPKLEIYARYFFDYYWVQCPKCQKVGPESRVSAEEAKKFWNEVNGEC